MDARLLTKVLEIIKEKDDVFDSFAECVNKKNIPEQLKAIKLSTAHSKQFFFESMKRKNSFRATNLITTLMLVLDDYKRISGNDYRWIATHLSGEIGMTKFSKEQMNHDIGVITFLLVEMGCSQNQAMDYVAEWLKMSRTKVRDAYYLLKKQKLPSMALIQQFMVSLHYRRFEFDNMPKTYTKAEQAFHKLFDVIEISQKFSAECASCASKHNLELKSWEQLLNLKEPVLSPEGKEYKDKLISIYPNFMKTHSQCKDTEYQ